LEQIEARLSVFAECDQLAVHDRLIWQAFERCNDVTDR
jgi:hypothetical protein